MMEKLEKSIKKRYLLFIATLVIIIIAVLFSIQNSIHIQKQAALLINKGSKQCILSESINSLVLSFNNDLNKTVSSESINSLKSLVDEFENSHNYLYAINNKNGERKILDSLLKISDTYFKSIIVSSKNIINNSNSQFISRDAEIIAETKLPYFLTMQPILREYQKAADENLESLKITVYFLVFIVFLVLVGEYIFILVPALKQLFKKNKELTATNKELAKSENKIKDNLLELTRLKTDLEAKEAYNRIFIEQAPTAIAMVDNNMCYMAVSQRWITDYKMEGQEFIGRSHYDLFPEIGDEWKAMHQKCLDGAININDEEPFIRKDGSVQWLYWDVRPWYDLEGNIGGILMHTGDITHIKENEEERIRIEKILDKTNEIARIGTWDIDLIKNTIFWSRIVREIHEVPEGFQTDLETGLNFYKEGKSRDLIKKVIQEAIEHGISYDVEVELVTLNNNVIWTRVIGQAEIVDGKCVRLVGVFQNINDMKLSKIALHKAHTELKAIFNSKVIAIASTDIDGIINQFNHGAEILTGYSASEMIGLQRPKIYHLQEEFDRFRIDIAKLYGKNPLGLVAQEELAKHNAYDTREWTYLRKDGSTIPVQLTLTSIKDEQGIVIGYLGISTDISAKRNAQDELLRKNQLLNFAEEITMMGNWQWDTVADNVQWSSNLYNIFKLDKETERISFDTYFSFVHPDDKEIVTKYFNNAVTEKKLNNFYHRIIAGDGTLKIIQLLGEVITDDVGNVIEMIGTCQDVTEQKMAEKKFRGLLESAPDAMVIVNEKGRIQLINKQAEKLFGYSAKELFDKPVEILIPERFLGSHSTHRNTFFLNPKTRGMGGEGKELFGINKSGHEIPIQISLSPLQTEEGLLVSAAIRDITKQKLAARKVIEAKESLEILANKLTDQNTQLADFAHITSHNLRAPVSNLNSLLGFYNTSESVEDKAVLFLKFEKVINHLTLTLNTLVDAIKIKNETFDNLEVVKFDEVLNKTKEILSGEILKSGIIITSNFSKIDNITYNKVYLESIFLNLVDNGIKYRSHDCVPELFIESEIEDGKVILRFKDNGLGIDLEKHGHKLFGLNKVFHRHPEAKGVGLFMTKTQIEAAGGTISATSKVNSGSIFKIKFN